MARTTRSQLADSWEVEDGSDGDISWKEESSPSEPDSPQPSQAHHQPRIPSDKARATTPPYSIDPALVFPTIDHSHSTARSSRKRTPQPSQIRQRPVKMASSTPNGRTSTPTVESEPSPSTTDPIKDILLPIATYLLSILKSTLLLLRQPIAYLLTIYLLLAFLTISYNFFTTSITNALSPLCRLPFASTLLPLCHYTYHNSPSTDPTNTATISSSPHSDPEFSQLIESTHNPLLSIISSTTTTFHLPQQMKQSELSLRDLRQIVRFSTLPSKSELIFEFDGFITSARDASFNLQKFNSHVGRTIDVTLSTARWTERVLDDLVTAEATSPTTHLPSVLRSILSPFLPIPLTHSALLAQYLQHTSIISHEISSLIAEAQLLLSTLTSLEDCLDVIHSISLTSQLTTQSDKDELLAHLWTMLGGNKGQLRKHDNHLRLLREVGGYRKVAWAHVSGVLLKLQGMQTELEELRERVDAAENEERTLSVGSGKGKKGTEKRKRTPLSVHLEAIRLGVERLEGERERGREIEGRHVRRVLGAGEEGKLESIEG